MKVGHSDGDAVYHALTDALLGAIGEPDIGQLFPDTDLRYEGADSAQFLQAAIDRVKQAGFEVGNVDITVVCEHPKIGPHKATMSANIAGVLGCETNGVNIKGKTHEGVDAIGEGRAIEAHCVVLLYKGEA